MTSQMTDHIETMKLSRTYHDTSSWEIATSDDKSVTRYWLNLIFLDYVIDYVIEIKITK